MGVGPSTKETTLHHFRDPLVDVVSADQEIDLAGIIVAGTPQDNSQKMFTGQRVGAWAEAMRLDGAIVSADGWGNSDVDLANAIAEIGSRGIPVVGMSFVGVQGAFVVTNKYMDAIVDINKSQEGIETCVVGENSLSTQDAKKALAMLKIKMNKANRHGGNNSETVG